MGQPVKILCDGVVKDNKAEIFMVSYDADGDVLSLGKAELQEPCKSKMAAQYLAVIQALENGLSLFALANVPIQLRINNRALVKQFTGKWPVKKKALLKLHHRAVAKISRFTKLTVKFHGENIAGLVTSLLKEQERKGESDGEES